MTRLTYKQFLELLSNYDEFDKKTLFAMYSEFGRNKINDYFDRYYQSLNEDNLSEFINKYAVYFEEQNIEDDTYIEVVDFDNAVSVILHTISKFTVMPVEFEYEQGLIIENARKNLKIVNNTDDEYRLYPNLDVAKILISLSSIEDVEKLKKLSKLPIVLDDNSIFREDIELIRKYIKYVNINNRIVDVDELKSLFSNLKFDGVNKIENIEEQIDLLEKLVYAKYNYYTRNLKWVFAIAKKGGNYPLSIEDKWQEGCIGLVKAINRFKTSKGYKFSTYATWWIKQCINRSIADKGYIIRKPVHLVDHIRNYELFVQKYETSNGIKPTIEECVDALGFSSEYIYKLQECALDVTSLDQTISNVDGRDEIIDFVVDSNACFEEKVISKDYIDRIIKEMNDCLNERERLVLMDRLGFNSDGALYTLEELGERFDITRERVRQIELKAKKKLTKRLKFKKIIEDNEK